ncbi:putative glycoside hydrolase [Paenibacillus sp. MMS18-CY102]|uniref:putative glycoside hydrolase n=1 Tax=Paenibacillus sp. MMS18-CY102 TaxID=2682849 RepID=UPI00136565D8|nr:putative glycoside hydrolase [Paenibacillus sp. MMS18-CY102]MWC30700.1 GTP-binding protein [Paenibacillus sp. MMS18-CY102]
MHTGCYRIALKLFIVATLLAGVGQIKGSTGVASAAQKDKHVRGIYISGWVAGSPARMNQLSRLLRRTKLNAVVIDVKDDFGRLTYRSNVPAIKRMGSDRRPAVTNMKHVLSKLHHEGIYTIGRVVVFKDPYLAQKQASWAIYNKNGSVWKDGHGRPWVDPYRTEVWNYNINVAKEAASLGFDEIQFDYVRFPEGIRTKPVKFANSEGWSRAEAIHRFLHTAKQPLHRLGVKVSADVFGLVTSTSDDMGIGQSWRAVSTEVDAISPMVYPSHYSDGMYGIAHPDMQPYAVVSHAMADAKRRNGHLSQSGLKPAVIRPWLQSFTATWVHPHLSYGQREIDQQIKALHDQGVEDYLLWNASCKYNL